MGDLSFHFNCQYKWDYAKQIIASPNIRSCLLMNANHKQIDYALLHCDFVVVRDFDPFNEYAGGANPDFEKAILDKHSPQEFLDYANARHAKYKGNSKLRFVFGWNELYSKRGSAEREQNQKMVDVGRALVSAGFGVGLGGWAADKSLYLDDINNGHWDNVIEFALENKAMVSLNFHEYTVTRTANQHLINYPDGYPDSILNVAAMQPQNWGTIQWEGNGIEGNYHIGRVAYLINHAKKRYSDVFKWFRGECAHDYKDDGALRDFIQNVYTPRFGRPTGVNSMRAYYQYLNGGSITDSEFAKMLFDDYKWLIDNDPPSCQANFIFAHDSGIWSEFDTTRQPGFVTMVVNLGQDDSPTVPIDKPDIEFTKFKRVKVRTNTGGRVRVRQGHNLNAFILDVVFGVSFTTVNVGLDDSGKMYSVFEGGYNWMYFKFDNGVSGWSASDLLEIVPLADCCQTLKDLRALLNSLDLE